MVKIIIRLLTLYKFKMNKVLIKLLPLYIYILFLLLFFLLICDQRSAVGGWRRLAAGGRECQAAAAEADALQVRVDEEVRRGKALEAELVARTEA